MGQSTRITATLPIDIAQRITMQLEQLTLLTNYLSTAKQTMFGLELEFWIVDKRGRPVEDINILVKNSINHSQIVLEVGSSQLEFNVTPVSATGKPFTAMLDELRQLTKLITAELKQYDAEIVFVGTLPTLDRESIKMTDNLRYHLIHREIWKDTLPQQIKLPDDQEEYRIEWVDSLEAIIPATSCQGHILIPYQSFVDAYNTTLVTAPIVHAMATNANVHLGKMGGADIRNYLFSGATLGRAGINDGYIIDPLDPFRRAADLCRFPPILTTEDDEDVWYGNIPSLTTLRFHLGTVWDIIVRGVYQPDAKDPHIRLELRYPSAQPTLHDNLAIFAFAFGLILNTEINQIYRQVPYTYVVENFDTACRFGPKAVMWWPNPKTGRLEKRAVSELTLELLPYACDGLIQAGVNLTEADKFLATLKERAQKKQTGSVWQAATTRGFEAAGYSRKEALARMFSLYRQLAESGVSVAAWPTPKSK